jgi:hypothetical protein
MGQKVVAFSAPENDRYHRVLIIILVEEDEIKQRRPALTNSNNV